MEPHKILIPLFSTIQKYSDDMPEMLNQFADTAASLLDSDGFSIYLLEDRSLSYGKLKIVAGGGPIGKKLLANGSFYYVPRREPFMRQQPPYHCGRVADLTWDEEVALIEGGKLAMGITACVARDGRRVARTNLPDQAGAPTVYDHPEHRGKYETAQGAKCISIIMDCIRDSRGSIIGVVKAENKTSGLGFRPDDEKVFDIILTAIQIGMIPFEKALSYRYTFGDRFTAWIVERIGAWGIEGKRNLKIAEILLDFSKKVQARDIRGLGMIYASVYEAGQNMIRVLELPADLLEALVRIQAIYEPLLGADVRYREHFIHQFHVFALGYTILNSNRVVRSSVLRSLGIGTDMDEAVRYWFVAAMFHDLAYVIQKIPEWLGTFLREAFGEETTEENDSQTRKVGFSLDWGDLFSLQSYEYHRGNLIAHAATRLALTPSERASLEAKVNRLLFDFQDHALFSALIMMNKMGLGLGDTETDQRQYALVKEAALAIALHSQRVSDLVRGIKNVLLPFNCSPLAFLLMFCDNAQEWGRPSGLWSGRSTEGLRMELSAIETDRDIRIVLNYSNVSRKLATEIGGREENWCLDEDTKCEMRMSITAYDAERKGKLLDRNY